MKTKVFIFFSLLTCHFLQAQNMKIDIMPHFVGIKADSLLLSMDITVAVENMDSKSALLLTPVLNGQEQKILLPAILLNGKQKQKLYLRSQALQKRNSHKKGAAHYLVDGIDESNSRRTISYRTSLPAESWMNDATLSFRKSVIRPEGEEVLKDTLLIALQNSTSRFFNIAAQETTSSLEFIPSPAVNTHFQESGTTKLKYRGSYISPNEDDVDIRNQKELNFSLEEAKIMAEINPQILSLRELYTVALSYTEDRSKFYQIIQISVKLYPVHPTANLNAAAAAIEMGNPNLTGKFLSMAPHDSLAYKNCRGVYELMTGNTYEGIRMLKAAKAEGSEEASYNLNAFFKRP